MFFVAENVAYQVYAEGRKGSYGAVVGVMKTVENGRQMAFLCLTAYQVYAEGRKGSYGAVIGSFTA